MPCIPVIAHPFRTSFGSVGDAVRFALTHPHCAKAERDAGRLRGATLIDFAWSLDHVVLGFSDGSAMHITIRCGEVDWSLDPTPSRPAATPSHGGVVEPIRLAFPWGEVAIRPRELIEQRVGARLRTLGANHTGFYVRFEGHPDLHFHALYRRDTGENVLYVIEDH